VVRLPAAAVSWVAGIIPSSTRSGRVDPGPSPLLEARYLPGLGTAEARRVRDGYLRLMVVRAGGTAAARTMVAQYSSGHVRQQEAVPVRGGRPIRALTAGCDAAVMTEQMY